ncbi:ABC transporter substrate-binding protein [Anaerovorax odorimutans]|uniref:ABC transporter substrate-binding protein n=1 Tax=Anaerovorax odorimutans TaxID=109327 RepID=A0ABT1RKL4_9FIRM|nr:ABC transporter substrate-binding protein [Anaerovorax odorimutans]MCQ4635501.1 ABC transporter substrate-binding protein [Anaerovorax odorimutans]
MKKRSLAILMALVMVLAGLLAGCGSGDSGSDKETVKIGLVQLVEHPSLDTIRESIIKQLEEEGYKEGDNVTIDYQNAQNEQANLKTICQGFVSDKCDLIIAISTPAAQAAYGETKDIPIIFSAVTDPVAAQLVESFEKPGGNITGTSDLIAVDKIMGLAQQITPEIKTIGAMYNSSEVNSVSVVNDLKEFAKKNGLTVKEAAVTNSNEIQQAAQSMAGKCDAVFSPIDNTVASAMSVATTVFNDAKIPFYVGADSMVKDGGLATYGINYEVLGAETAKMAAEVLKGGDTSTMPVKVMDDMQAYINQATADAIGAKIPQDILDSAKNLGE